MTIFAVVNHKGGVGKTTTAINLARCLWDRQDAGRVMLVDLDPQADCTEQVGGRPGAPHVGDVLTGRVKDYSFIHTVDIDGRPVLLIPSAADLESDALQIVTRSPNHLFVADMLEGDVQVWHKPGVCFHKEQEFFIDPGRMKVQ